MMKLWILSHTHQRWPEIMYVKDAKKRFKQQVVHSQLERLDIVQILVLSNLIFKLKMNPIKILL